jgi:hypothetical protein
MATNAVPYEVLSSPFALYYAAADTAPPALDDEPDSSDWELVGSNRDLNYDREPGVVIALPQSVNSWRSHGDLGTRKRFPTEADLMIRLRLVDMTLEQMQHVLNFNSITTPVAGTSRIGLTRSFSVATRALLLRFDMSPYVATGKSQFYVYRAQQIASTEIKNAQGTPMGFDLEYAALVNPGVAEDIRFGWYEAKTT